MEAQAYQTDTAQQGKVVLKNTVCFGFDALSATAASSQPAISQSATAL